MASRDLAVKLRAQARELDEAAKERKREAEALRRAADALSPRRGRPRKVK